MRSAEDECLHDATLLAEFIGVPVRHMRQTVVSDTQHLASKRDNPNQPGQVSDPNIRHE